MLRQLRPGLPESEDSCIRLRAPREGEVSKQSDWKAAPLDAAVTPKAKAVLRFRAPKGTKGTTQSDCDAVPMDPPPGGLRK